MYCPGKNEARWLAACMSFFVYFSISTAFSAQTYIGDGSVVSTVEINDLTENGPVLLDMAQYGWSIANIGDLNGDGVTDIAVGVIYDDSGGTDKGAIYLHFMNIDGSVDSTVEINDLTENGPVLLDSDSYGQSISNLGDLNGDGVNDIAVGAYKDSSGGFWRGAVHIHFMNTGGSVDSTVEINDLTENGPNLSDGDQYGFSVANLGDLNGDGTNDIAVGAIRDGGSGGAGSYRGAVHISYMNTDGSVDSTVEINDTTLNGPVLANDDSYGRSIANIGDLNGDGVVDIAVGAWMDDAGGSNRGVIHIHFMNTDGSIDSTVEINDLTENGPVLLDNDYYGYSVAGIGDLNGDGVRDIVVGAYGDDMGGDRRGTIHISFMNTDGSVDSTVEINGLTENGPVLLEYDFYGYSVANIGDLNGDGVVDIAVGARGDDAGGNSRGAIHIHFMYGYEAPDRNTFDPDTRCHYEVPPQTTWIKLEPSSKDGTSGILLTWTQYSADKINIKIDDGTGSFPWKIECTSNDGHEFLPNVKEWQNIKLKPVNHCKQGDYGETVSYSKYPLGWFNTQ